MQHSILATQQGRYDNLAAEQARDGLTDNIRRPTCCALTVKHRSLNRNDRLHQAGVEAAQEHGGDEHGALQASSREARQPSLLQQVWRCAQSCICAKPPLNRVATPSDHGVVSDAGQD